MGVIGTVGILWVGDAVAGDWPRWRGPEGNGISTESGWRWQWEDGEPEVAWRAEVGVGFSSVVVADGRVLTTGNDGEATDTVTCLDAASGAVVWNHAYPAPLDDKFYEGGPSATPTVDGSEVLVLSKRGTLMCLALEDGAVRWEVNVGEAAGMPLPSWGFGGSPVVVGEMILLNVGKSGMALKRSDGGVIWKSEAEEAGYSTPVVFEEDGQTRALFSSGKEFSAVKVETGEVVWSHRWATRYGVNASDPIVAGERVFLASGYGKGCVLLDTGGDDPSVVWQSKVLRTQMNPCVLVDGFLYGTDGDQGDRAPLKCVAFATGETEWSEPDVGTGGIMVADGKLIVLTARGELVIAPASPDGFEPTLRMQILGGKCWTVPVLANGRIYCRNAAGDLACADVRTN